MHELSEVHGKKRSLAKAAVVILEREQPMALRGLFYRVVRAGHLPSTSRDHVEPLQVTAVCGKAAARTAMTWIFDHVRSRRARPRQVGLETAAYTRSRTTRTFDGHVRPNGSRSSVRKLQVAGTIKRRSPTIRLRLQVNRVASIGYAHEIAKLWRKVRKPILRCTSGTTTQAGTNRARPATAGTVQRPLHLHVGRWRSSRPMLRSTG